MVFDIVLVLESLFVFSPRIDHRWRSRIWHTLYAPANERSVELIRHQEMIVMGTLQRFPAPNELSLTSRRSCRVMREGYYKVQRWDVIRKEGLSVISITE